ncbi:MAG: DNA polymerase III subunit gamma/tau [Gemmatimonadaceae bacterium]|nr:DNA polymerase III subunit gamma/tau [Gemmatimonadaceae bacterium]
MIALARKYRPKNFAQVAVQTHVSNTLKGAIARDRVAHGYLLCGPRGTGKTTLARVLAMALNCEQRKTRDDGEPCGVCGACTRIWSGSASLDVIEIDAASNRGVDDARELRERAMYAPSTSDGYKVYIVDEAHMLTREAWNALLKILEEPPPRVVFVFATTEPQKIAQTAAPVLSRLQRFDLRRINPAEIRDRLASVLDDEGVTYEPDALQMLARAADGGLRDALSLTDQVLAFGDDSRLTSARVRDALGLVPEDELLALLAIVGERRAADVFGSVERLTNMGVDLVLLLTGLADLVRAQLAIVLGGDPGAVSSAVRERLTAMAPQWRAGDLLRVLQAIADVEARLRKSSQPQLVFETLLVRLALLDRTLALEEVLAGLGDVAPRAVATPRSAARSAAPVAARAATVESPRAAPPADKWAPQPDKWGAPPRHPARRQSARRQSARRQSARRQSARRQSARRGASESRGGTTDGSSGRAPGTGPAPDRRRLGFGDRGAQGAGRGMLAALLARVQPTAVTAGGLLTLECDDPGDFPVVTDGLTQVTEALRDVLPAITRVQVKPPADGVPDAPRERLTTEGVKQERVAALSKQDPVLGAAVEALDLELLE